MLLALETATDVCSVAFCDDSGAIYERRTEQHGSHSEQLFLFVEELQKEHNFSIPDLDAVLVSEGPGSYTGLRISASAVKGLLFQTDVPLYGINTLASFAKRAMQNNASVQTIHSIINARRVHLYHQQFGIEDEVLVKNDEVEVIPIEVLESMIKKDDIIIGTGLNRIDEEVCKKAKTIGAGALTAKSLISLYQEGRSAFIEKVVPESFEPKYYTSNQGS